MSDEKNAVIVFSFPEPDDSLELGAIIVEAKKFFEGRDNIKIHLAVRNAAQQIVDIFDPEKQGESNLVEHAKRELALAGNDQDFNDSIIGAIRAFTMYGHSGGSAPVAIAILNDLLQFKNLTPLTDDPNEWIHHGPDVWPDGTDTGVWQNCRNSEAFSKDGGKTYTLNSEGSKIIHHSAPYVKEEEGGPRTEPNS